MKILNALLFIILTLVLVTTSCKKNDTTSQETPGTEANAPDPNAAAVTTGGQKHFICPNNCEGSGGDAQGNCPVCGTAYVHNQAYHNQSPTATTPNVTPIQINENGQATIQSSADPNAAAQPTTPPAAQNAKGEWHFVCSKACGGGAGAQGTCPKCGADLTHNQAFHQ